MLKYTESKYKNVGVLPICKVKYLVFRSDEGATRETLDFLDRAVQRPFFLIRFAYDPIIDKIVVQLQGCVFVDANTFARWQPANLINR